MQFTPDQAKGLAMFLAGSIDTEQKTTSKVIAAIPHQNLDYRPDPKSKTALELAAHIAQTDIWFLDSLLKGEFGREEGPAVPATSGAEIAAWYDQNYAALAPKVAALPGDFFAKNLQFYHFNLPAVMYLSFLMNHMIHHRGQLSTYLRAMGGKCPSIYGGSADEPFDMSASA
jgi:uncharacterized damage-inducible protein DinB